MRFLAACQAFWKVWKGETEKKTQTPEPIEASHLRLLSLLQKEGRLLDFLKEDLKGYTDAQIGAAVRKIQIDCAESLEEHVTVRPLADQAEGEKIVVPVGYDPKAMKLLGKVHGYPPYKGVIRHRGWKAHKLSLGFSGSMGRPDVLAPMEIEVEG